MKLFEMTLYQGADDSISQLYFENTEMTREKFLDKIEQAVREEFKKYSKNQNDEDLIFFYKEILNESCRNLAIAKEKFIKYGNVENSLDFFFTIKEKFVE